MAEQRPPAAGGPAPERTRASQRDDAPRPSQSVIYWRYLIFWLLFFGFVYFVTLYGIVAEA
jgi:hypothetical protein